MAVMHYSATGSQDTFSDRPVISTTGPRRLGHARANFAAHTLSIRFQEIVTEVVRAKPPAQTLIRGCICDFE